MKLKIAYWAITGLFCLMMSFSGLSGLTGNPQAVETFRHLGYPDYFRLLLGVGKLLGAVALLVPLVPRTLREWAYGGFVINLVSATVSHYASGDPVGQMMAPVIFLGLLLTSHQLWRRVEHGTAEQQVATRPAMG